MVKLHVRRKYVLTIRRRHTLAQRLLIRDPVNSHSELPRLELRRSWQIVQFAEIMSCVVAAIPRHRYIIAVLDHTAMFDMLRLSNRETLSLKVSVSEHLQAKHLATQHQIMAYRSACRILNTKGNTRAEQ